MKDKKKYPVLNLKHRENFTVNYIQPLIKENLLSMTIPDKPNSSRQKYRITAKGKEVQERLLRDSS
ncbi:MAG: Fic family protein [bacterium]